MLRFLPWQRRYVEDEDLLSWGLTTIERRKFFRHAPSAPLGAPPAPRSSKDRGASRVLEVCNRVLRLTGPRSVEPTPAAETAE